MDKLKASDKLAFPLDLDMATLLASVTQDNGHSKVGLRGNTELYERIFCETLWRHSSCPSLLLGIPRLLDGESEGI